MKKGKIFKKKSVEKVKVCLGQLITPVFVYEQKI